MQFATGSSWRQLLRLAGRNLVRNRARTGMTTLAVVVGVTSLILAGGFIEDLFHQLGEALIRSQSGHLQVGKVGFASHGSRSPEKYLISDVQQRRDAIRRLPQVEEIAGRVRFSALLNNGRTDLPVLVEGVEPDIEARIGTYTQIVSGRALTPDDGYAAMLGQGVASAMKVGPGDRINLLVSTSDGALNTLDFEVVGTFRTFSKEFDARAVRVALPAAQELVATAGVNMIVLLLEKTSQTDAVASILERSLTGAGLEVLTWTELNDFYEKTVALYRRQLAVLEFIILVMVGLGVVNLVNMAVLERVGEFGTMRALGNGNIDVFMLVMVENVMLAACGATLGLLVGAASAWLVSLLGIPMPPPPNSDMGYTARILLTPAVLLKAFAVGFLATVLAALPPAARVARMPIAEQLRRAI